MNVTGGHWSAHSTRLLEATYLLGYIWRMPRHGGGGGRLPAACGLYGAALHCPSERHGQCHTPRIACPEQRQNRWVSSAGGAMLTVSHTASVCSLMMWILQKSHLHAHLSLGS